MSIVPTVAGACIPNEAWHVRHPMRQPLTMAHPRMYSDDDPYLSDLRKICLALPESVEVEAWGRPTFRAGKKLFAIFTGLQNENYTVVFKPEAGEGPALLGDPRFYSPPYWGASGWVGLDFTAAPVDWSEVAELVESSYRQVALKRMIVALDAAAESRS